MKRVNKLFNSIKDESRLILKSFILPIKKIVLYILLGFVFQHTIYATSGEGECVLTDIKTDRFTFVCYREGYMCTFTNTPIMASITTTEFPKTGSCCIIDGMRVNHQTFMSGWKAGMKFFINNDRSWTQTAAVYNFPRFVVEGNIISVNTSSNTVKVHNIIRNDLGGKADPDESGPISEDLTISYSDSYVIKYEGQSMTDVNALKVGRHVRIYKARKQTIFAFTPEAMIINDPPYVHYGSNLQAYVQQGFFCGYNADKVYFVEEKDNEYFDSWKFGKQTQSMLIGGQFVNSVGAAARVGDRVTFVPFASPGNGLEDKNAFIRAQDEETVEGWVKSINANEIIIEETLCPTGRVVDLYKQDIKITLNSDAVYYKNGNNSIKSEIKVGQYVMISKEWDGAILVRDPDISKQATSNPPAIKPRIIKKLVVTSENLVWNQPDTIFATENQTAKFRIVEWSYVNGLSMNFQWYRNNNKIPGATFDRYNHIASLNDNGANFTCMVQNLNGSVTSKPIVLIVKNDTSALKVDGISIVNNSTIAITYNKEVLVGNSIYGSERISNYKIDNGININSVTLIGNKKTIIIKTSTLTKNIKYTITLNNIRDISFFPNQIKSNSIVSVYYKVKFRYFRFTLTAKGSLNPLLVEMRYLENGISYGTEKNYWGKDNGLYAFDNNNTSKISLTLNDIVGLDMGIGNELSPDQIMINLDGGSGRDIKGFKVEGSNDKIQWYQILNSSTTITNGSSVKIPINLSGLDPDEILTGSKQIQQINFALLQDHFYSERSLLVSPTATSGLPVSLFVLSGPAILNGNQLQFTDIGEVILEAKQEGNDQYYSAYPIIQHFSILDNPTFSSNLIKKEQLIIKKVNSNLHLLNAENSFIKIIDIRTVILFEMFVNTNHLVIDINKWKKGIYIIELITKNGIRKVEKIIITD